MGAMMAYGAYVTNETNIGSTVITIALLDTVVAVAAGLAIFPIVFANGLEPGQGPGHIVFDKQHVKDLFWPVFCRDGATLSIERYGMSASCCSCSSIGGHHQRSKPCLISDILSVVLIQRNGVFVNHIT